MPSRVSDHRATVTLPRYAASAHLSAPQATNEEMHDGESEAGESNLEGRQQRGWQDDDDDEGDSDAYVPDDQGDFTGDKVGVGMDDAEPDVNIEGDEQNGSQSDGERDGKSRARRNSRKSKKTQPKASDYNEDVEALLNYASGLMRSLIVSENPMPSVDESIELAGDAYRLARSDRPHVNPPAQVKHISIVRTYIYSTLV